MELDRNGLEILDAEECWKLLSVNHLGRLAVVAGNRAEVFPLNYVVDDTEGSRSLVFLTSPGTKLAAAVIGMPAAFEIDAADPVFHTGWSVVAHGMPELVESTEELVRVQALPLRPWGPSDKRHFMRLYPTEIDGRRIPAPKGH